MVWRNTGLAVLNLGAGAAGDWLATGRAWAAPLFTTALLLCPPFVLSAGSELAAQPVITLAFGAAAALARTALGDARLATLTDGARARLAGVPARLA